MVHFDVSDMVYLYLPKEHLKYSSQAKVQPLQYGPFKIVKHVLENAYLLDLPLCLFLHPIFNVKFLHLYYLPHLFDDLCLL